MFDLAEKSDPSDLNDLAEKPDPSDLRVSREFSDPKETMAILDEMAHKDKKANPE